MYFRPWGKWRTEYEHQEPSSRAPPLLSQWYRVLRLPTLSSLPARAHGICPRLRRYGTGYFYFPGTETCLKIGGLLRFEKYFEDAKGSRIYYEWHTRARIQIEAKNDSSGARLFLDPSAGRQLQQCVRRHQ